MKKLLPNILITLIILFSACNKNEDIPEVKATDRTVLVYIAANSNDLASFAREDVQEMTIGMADADDTRYNLLVYSDTGSNPALFRFGKDRDGKVVKDTISSYPSQDSLDPEIMKSVFNDAFKAYPAENYGLVLWTHAEGWLASPNTRYLGPSGSPKKYMDIAEFGNVLKNAPYFDYIYFETCFMSSIEVLYELREFTDYFIACPTETPGPGAPYDLILEALLTNNVIEIGKTYFDHYNNNYKEGVGLTNSNWTAGAAIAIIDSKELDALAVETGNLLPIYLLNSLPNQEIPRTDILCYDPYRSNYYYDMAKFIEFILVDNEEVYTKWKTLYDKAVVYFETTDMIYSNARKMVSMRGATGLSTYIPRSSQSTEFEFYKTYEWYKAGGWQEAGW